MFSPRRFIAIAKKEFLELKRNKLFFTMTILAPIALYLLFAYGFPLDPKNMSMAIVDFDNTALSRSLADGFQNATDRFNVVKVASNYPPAVRAMELGEIRMMLVIPEDFSKNIKKGVSTTVQVLVDGVYPNTANIIGGYAESIIAVFRMKILAEHSVLRGGVSNIIMMPVNLKVSAWYNPSFRSEDFIIPGIIALVMIFFPPIVATISLAKEKETGSILNMYCSSVTKTEYLLGKMLPYVIISYINFLIFFALTIFLFKVPMRGDVMIILVASFFYVASCIAIGLFVAVLVGSQVAAILITFVGTVMPAFLYSGFMVPVSNLTSNSRSMSYMIPCTYYIDILRKVMVKGAGFFYVKNSVFALIIFCVALYLICIKLFKKRLK